MFDLLESLKRLIHSKINVFRCILMGTLVICLLALTGTVGVYRVEASSITVNFPDANLQAVVRQAINKPIGTIYQTDLANLTSLNVENKSIINLEGLEYCTNLNWLDISSNEITDIAPISDLVNLQNLFLNNNEISDISALSNLTSLTYLDASWNQITDILPLSNLVNLQSLFINNNQINSISALANLTHLTHLYLNSNQINNISILSPLSNLQVLDIGDNEISDISVLSNLTNLTYLDASWNQITDISPLSNLINLQTLFINNNRINSISALSNLTKLSYLYLNANQISNISTLSTFAALQVLNLGENQINNISPLSNLTQLTYLYIGSNQIIDVTSLSNLVNLQYLDLDNNQISNVSALRNMTQLVYLDLGYNHHINDISPLTNLIKLQHLALGNNVIVNIATLTSLINLQYLDLNNNEISSISALINNPGLVSGDAVNLTYNNLNLNAGSQNMSDIQTLINRGVIVTYQPQNGVTQTPTTTMLSSSLNPSTYDQQIIFTASVSPIPDSGTVQFQDNGTNLGSPIIIGSSGRAIYTTSLLPAGTHTIDAVYNGDTNYGSSTGFLSQTVYQAPTITGLVSSANPSIWGEPVTFTTTVNPIPDGGTIQLQDGGLNIGSPLIINASGQATFTDAVLSVGNHAITAVYSGDADFVGSTSTSVTQTVTQVVTVTALISSVNPSTTGQIVTFTATVSPIPDGGTMQFEDNGNNIGGPHSLSGSSQATYTTSSLALGNHTITAIYSGDVDFTSSTGNLSQTVQQAMTQTVLTSSASLINLPTPGQPVYFIASVSVLPPGIGIPTGTVQFQIAGNNIGNPVTLSNGVANSSLVSNLSYGRFPITAIYSGDSYFEPSTGNMTQSIRPVWDINGDGICNIYDLVLIGNYWGETGAPGWIPEDLNQDGVINIYDLVILGNDWGQTW